MSVMYLIKLMLALTARLVLDVQGKEDLRNLRLPRRHHLRLQLRRDCLQQQADHLAFRQSPKTKEVASPGS